MDNLDIFGRHHIMVDIETMSTHQNAVIVSIGAVAFTFEKGIENEFLVNVDPMSCHKLGLHIEASTVKWWSEQPKEISDLWKIAPKPLPDALNSFNDFVGENAKQWLWSHGAVFDLGVLRSAFEVCKINRKWKYWCENDSRTVFNLLGVRNDKIRRKQSGHHSALDDARSQAQTFIELFQY